MKRSIVYVLTLLLAAIGGVVVAAPAYAAVGISPNALFPSVHASDTGQPVVDITVCASFDQPVEFIEALVSFSDGTPGVAIDSPPGTRTQHWCGTYANIGPLKPGPVAVTVNWGANNGNGLSEGHAESSGTFVVPGPPPRPKKTAALAADLGHASNAMWIAGAIIAIGGAAVAIAAAVLGIATGGALLVAALGLLGGGACAWMAAALSDLSIDPPDSDYKVTVVPQNPDLASLTASLSLTPTEAAAFDKLRDQWTAEAGLALAMVTALYKAEGAAAANDTQWEQTQTLAVAGFAKQLSADLGTEQPLRAAVVNAINAGGSGITPALVDQAKTKWNSGLSAEQTKWLTLGDPKSTTANELHGVAVSADSAALTQASPLAAFTDPASVAGSMASAESSVASTLSDWSALLTAHPTGAVPDSGPVPAPSGVPSVAPSPTAPAPAASPTPGPVTISPASALTDGGFESSPLVNLGYITLLPKDSAKLGPGWVIDSGSVDLVGPLWGSPAAEGLQFIDLNGNATPNQATIHVDVPTKSGHAYQVTFQLAGNVLETPIKTMRATFGGQSQDFTFDTKGHTSANLGWTGEKLGGPVCASSSSTRLTFASTMTGERGPLLDGVAVTDMGTCDPGGIAWWLIVLIVVAALALLAGGGWFLLAARRKRTAVPA